MVIQLKLRIRLETFDRQVIRRRWKTMNRGPLSRAGLLVRKIARQSIRRVGKKGKPSKPGRPPKARAKGNTGLKLIFSVPNKLGTSVAVGPVGFGDSSPVPALHEHGGTGVRRVWIPTGKRGKRGMIRKSKRKTVVYKPRPFMLPALMKGREKMPQFWKNSLR